MLVFLPNNRVSAIFCYCASKLVLFHVSECSLSLPGMLKSTSLRVGVKTAYNAKAKRFLGLLLCFFKNDAWIILITCWRERKFNNIRWCCFSLMMASFRRKACRTQLELSSSSTKKPLSSLQRKNEHTFYSEADVRKQLWTDKVFLKKKFLCFVLNWNVETQSNKPMTYF